MPASITPVVNPNASYQGQNKVKIRKGVKPAPGRDGGPSGGGILPGDQAQGKGGQPLPKPSPSPSPVPTPGPGPSPAPAPAPGAGAPPASAQSFRQNVQSGMKPYRQGGNAQQGSLGFAQARSAAMDKAKGLLGGSIPSRAQAKIDRNKKRMTNLQKPSPTPTPVQVNS
jgi:hypothetical protein